MIKRHNYTGRRKILQEHVSVGLTVDEHGVAVFVATADLQSYGFPPASRVFLEAQRHASFMRFTCGTVADFHLPELEDRRLTEIVGADAVAFRLKVVAAGGEDAQARLLGLADNIRPILAESGPSKSLLEIVPSDLPHDIWRIEFHEDGAPILLLDRPLFSQRAEFVGNGWFRTLVLPIVFRSVLTRIKLVEKFDDDESASWQARWLRMAQQLPGVSKAPPAEQNVKSEEWIDDAVTAFCRRNSLRERFDELFRDGTT